MTIISKPPATVARKAVTIRMPEPVAETLHWYANFLGSSLDHVVVEALKFIFKKDTEFKAWQEQNQDTTGHEASAPSSAHTASPAPPPFFADKKRDGNRPTVRGSREC